MEINAAVGEKVLEAFPQTKVDVHNPAGTYQYRNKTYDKYLFRGDRGAWRNALLAQQERQCFFCQGGIDSPVAGYMIAKRGVVLEATYFHAPPYTSERAKQKVVDLAKKWPGILEK